MGPDGAFHAAKIQAKCASNNTLPSRGELYKNRRETGDAAQKISLNKQGM